MRTRWTLLCISAVLFAASSVRAATLSEVRTDPFNAAPSSLEKQVSDANATLKLPPLTGDDAKPQDCGDVGPVFRICSKTVYGMTISAWGHEFPPVINHVTVILWSNDPPTVKLGVILALLIYDTSAIMNDRKDKVQPLLDALFNATPKQTSLDGVDAQYTHIQLLDGKLNFTIEPRK